METPLPRLATGSGTDWVVSAPQRPIDEAGTEHFDVTFDEPVGTSLGLGLLGEREKIL